MTFLNYQKFIGRTKENVNLVLSDCMLFRGNFSKQVGNEILDKT